MGAVQYAKEISRTFTDRYGSKISRSLHITGATATFGMFLAFGKLIMGICSMSLFTCIHAIYSFGMIGAKGIAFTGIRRAGSIREQYRYYRWSGITLIVASLLYIFYSVRLFFYPLENTYHMYIAIGIAAVTFTEIGLSIRGVVITRHDHTLLVHSIKMINLSASLIALVLTQTAILSFANPDADLSVTSNANGIIGVIMGAAATFVGILMVGRKRP